MAAHKLNADQRRTVIRMLAERRSYRDIAEVVGCSDDNITWYARRYKDLIAEARAAYDAQAVRDGIFSREARLARMQARYDALMQIVSERGANPEMAEFAGGTTGYLVREPQIVKVYEVKKAAKPAPAAAAQASLWDVADVFATPEPEAERDADPQGEGANPEMDDERLVPTGSVQVVYVAKLDAALERALAKLEDDAAKEMGDRQKRVDVTSGGLTWEDLLRTAQGADQMAAEAATAEAVADAPGLDEVLAAAAAAIDADAGAEEDGDADGAASAE